MLCSANSDGEPRPAQSAPDEAGKRGGHLRFQILRPHAEGGLGQVFLARDEELAREVALKEIKPRWANHPGSRARFTREAEITGGLEHPGIVPVYGLGTYPDGRPYYAMRFIRGASLKEAIEAFHAPPAADEPLSAPQRNLELRRLLARLIDVCQAIDYAHSRKVIHRDLKPGNIMLGPYGETLVVDWGLAKALAQPGDEACADDDSGEFPLVPSGDSEPTRLGAAVGTPGYMSPEQASGRHDEVGPASDIFSLGATLYDLLVGQPPYAEGDLIRRAQEADYLPPRSIRADVPRPLEAVCLKAMSRRPEDRYAVASDLASEIERWLAGEQVQAYRERPLERAVRWARKHRAWVAAGGLALALVTAISTMAFVVVSYQNWEIAGLAAAEQRDRQLAQAQQREAEQARDDEAAARRELEIAHRQAHADRVRFAAIVHQLGKDVYQIRRHRPLLESGINSYREFLVPTDDPAADDRLVTARFQAALATLLEALDDYAGAKAAYHASIAAYESLLAGDVPPAGKRELRSELGTTYGNLGAMYVQTPETLAAISALDKAIAIQRELVSGTGAPGADRRELARHHYNRGYVRAHHGLPGSAEDLQAAVEIQQSLAAAEPDSPQIAMELAVMEIELGLRQAAQARQVLATAEGLPAVRRQAAEEELRQARRMVEEGVQSLARLSAADPVSSEFRKELADGYAELAQAQALAGELSLAEQSLARSIGGFADLLADFPADPDFRRSRALARFRLAFVKELAKDPAAAEKSYREAAEEQERLVRDFPDRGLYWTDAGRTWSSLSALRGKAGDDAGAMTAGQEAAAKFSQAWKLANYDPRLRPQAEEACLALARIAIQSGNHAELAELGQSHAALRPECGEELLAAAKFLAAAAALAARDENLSSEQRRQRADGYAAQGIDLVRRAVAQGFRDERRLRTDGDLAPLRERAEFQELLENVSGKR